MANHASAKKAARQAERKRIHNQRILTASKTATKKFRLLLQKKFENKDDAKKELLSQLNSTQSELMSAARKGVIKANKASRLISRLSHQMHEMLV